MGSAYVTRKRFDKENFAEEPLPKGEYDGCSFTQCDFSNANLSESNFISCEFCGCNLSMAKLNKTSWQEVTFKECKMLGLRFDQSNPFNFSVNFENTSLNHSSFYKLKMKKTVFRNSQLQEVDFTECDLTHSIFDACDLTRATFENTNLEKVDFRTSFNYSIDPEINRIKKARFSLNGITGLLNKYDIEID